MHPMLKTLGFLSRSFVRTDSFEPIIVLQLSLANPTTFNQGMLLVVMKFFTAQSECNDAAVPNVRAGKSRSLVFVQSPSKK